MILILVLPVAVLLLVSGVALFGKGFLNILRKMRIRNSTSTDLASLREGPVQVNGEAKVHNETIPAPFSKEECVCFWFSVEVYHRSAADPSWRQVESGFYGVPFRLTDESGDVIVDPVSGTVDELHRSVYQVSRGRVPPPEITDFAERLTSYVEDAGDRYDLNLFRHDYGYDLRFTEAYVKPGDQMCVLGDAVSGERGGSSLYETDWVITAGSGIGEVVISSESIREDVAGSVSVFPWLFGGGVAAALGAVGTWGIVQYLFL